MNKDLEIIGSVSKLSFPKLSIKDIPVRIDTGAKTSALWASNVSEVNNVLRYSLFSPNSPFYSGKVIKTKEYTTKKIRSTNGEAERRYIVKQSIIINGKKVRASFTLANRERQVYPILVGRNILRGKFVVDIKHRNQTKLQ